MAKVKNMKKFLLVCLIVVLSACTFQTKHRGYVFPEDLESKLANIHTTAQLQDEIGDPQTRTMYGDEVWVYYGADENMRGPLPLTYDNKTVLLAWVKGGKVLKTKVLHDEDLKDVQIADGETEIPAAIELNALEELFNNVGRFSPAGLGQ
jgi:outer membrane protein assembly factor BamE (lipoprotein component of BamABCDE complex)